MSENTKPSVGTIGWIDLTVENADEVRDFYSKIIGWKTSPISMGDYSDYTMITPDTNIPVSGVCHAKGTNAGLPAKWLIYINVADINESIIQCEKLGGKILTAPKDYSGMGKYCVIEDTAGAVCALFEPK
ncbi:MAG: VOC family protein [Bacteroidetes bacterium]|nr:VOC family protein [Bacteroidota bacterium]MBU1680121.1 VOC family protein [Bacteroidota bacterium]